MYKLRGNFVQQFCFNRYMVECESEVAKKEADKMDVLIDTWWNVNDAG